MSKGKTKEELLGETALDIGKLIFGGIVLAGIFNSDFDKIALVLIGLAISGGTIAGGIYLMTKNREK